MSWGLKTPSINPHNLSNDLRVIRKFTFHSSSENSFITILSHQSLFLTRIPHVREARGSRKGAKWSIADAALLEHSRSIRRCCLPSDITISKRDSVHLTCTKSKAQSTYKMYRAEKLSMFSPLDMQPVCCLLPCLVCDVVGELEEVPIASS